ncbi:UPF0481 protein At3g47200-like [Prosopis cineraria]|uniref:UPF0481 protein At3g47200-like n=1 Tax=Prosopis cineraria TaxID=364024 RepID=UPI00241054AB|nr:UPF0481 protein At3g47200-like [Prosopis cineraria]
MAPSDQWIVDIQMTLGSVNHSKAKACCISKVAEKIRQANDTEKDYNYRPQFVAMGPFHSGTRVDLQIMEETKWSYMNKLLARPTHGNLLLSTVQTCSKAILGLDSIVRLSYAEKIQLEPEQLARIILLDACFLLELLLGLHDITLDGYSDKKQILRVLTDLTLLENQIPFFVLTTLSRRLFKVQEQEADKGQELDGLLALSQDVPGGGIQLSPEKIAKSLFGYDIAAAGVYHFLHLMHLSSVDPFDKDVTSMKAATQELKRCATELQAARIEIYATSQKNTNASNLTDNKTGIVASALREFVDRFDFYIDFKESERKLIIPTLYIKEGTDVKWRNLIAWEQSGLKEISFKFTSYAYFLKGLICSVQDIRLLKSKNIIVVDEDFAISEHKLLFMFQNITAGAENMDSRYSALCVRLNAVPEHIISVPVTGWLTMKWHHFQSFLELLGPRIKFSIKIQFLLLFSKYIPDPWMLLKLVAATILLVLTSIETAYTVKDYYAPGGP